MNTIYILLCAAPACALVALAPVRTGAQPATDAVATAAPGDTLSFVDALARVLDRSPSLAAAAARASAAQGVAGQAAAWNNPAILLEAENVGGGYSGLDRAELSLLVSQEFELGGRRSARVAAARASADVVAFDAQDDSREIRAETRRRYADVAHAEERLRIARLAAAIAEDLVAAAETRVTSGAAPVSDRALATAAHARSQLELGAAQVKLRTSRVALASLWGEATFAAPVSLPGSAIAPGLPADSAAAWATRSPALSRSQLVTYTLRAETAVERSLRVPTLDASLGVRRIEADDTHTFLAAISFPLPLWDRRDRAVGAAEARVRASELVARQQRVETTANIAGVVNSLNRTIERVRALANTVRPPLQNAVESMRAAYRIGGVSYPDLLEVQRALVEVESDTNDAQRLIAYQIAYIERLTGRTIQELRHE